MRLLAFATLLSLSACSFAWKGAPATFVRTANEAGIWRSIDVDREISGDKTRAWSVVVDALSSKYDLEVLDKESGYLRTSWQFVVVNGKRNELYRSRVVTKFNQGWSVLQMKAEAQYLWKNDEWLEGYDTAQLKDIQSDLEGRLGRNRP